MTSSSRDRAAKIAIGAVLAAPFVFGIGRGAVQGVDDDRPAAVQFARREFASRVLHSCPKGTTFLDFSASSESETIVGAVYVQPGYVTVICGHGDYFQRLEYIDVKRPG